MLDTATTIYAGWDEPETTPNKVLYENLRTADVPWRCGHCADIGIRPQPAHWIVYTIDAGFPEHHPRLALRCITCRYELWFTPSASFVPGEGSYYGFPFMTHTGEYYKEYLRKVGEERRAREAREAAQ